MNDFFDLHEYYNFHIDNWKRFTKNRGILSVKQRKDDIVVIQLENEWYGKICIFFWDTKSVLQ